MNRRLLIAVLFIVALGFALPYLPITFLDVPLERALARELGRRVEIDSASLSLFSGPGFALNGVTIHEDPRAGIEPFAYVGTLETRVDLLALLRGRLGFSSLRLVDATINLVKTESGPWNFQFLSEGNKIVSSNLHSETAASLPAMKMRGGRMNLKFGQTKSVFYFDDTDLDVSPLENGAMEVRFAGVPSRTDRTAQSFGHFFIRGTAAPGPAGMQLDLSAELEPSTLDGLAHLFDQHVFNLPGTIALNARLAGPVSSTDVTGTLHWENSRRNSHSDLEYKGAIDFRDQSLELQSVSAEAEHPFSGRVRIANFLVSPRLEASLNIHEMPAAELIGAAREWAIAVPEKLAAEGALSGTAEYYSSRGWSGKFGFDDLTLTLPNSPAIHAETATLIVDGSTISLASVGAKIGEAQSVQIEGNYLVGANGGLDLKIVTRGMDLMALRSVGLNSDPLLGRVPQGSWRGSVRYQIANRVGAEPVWSGEYELQNAKVAIDGIAEPVRIQSALVSANHDRAVISKIRGSAGEVHFTGDYRWEPESKRPHKFRLVLEEGTAEEFERLLRPTITRGGGFLARTFRFRNAGNAPDWLSKRQAEGTVAILGAIVGDHTVSIKKSHIVWNGISIAASGITGQIDDSPLGGSLTIDLSGNMPVYRFEGELAEVPYKSGKLDFKGTIESAGLNLDLLTAIKAKGEFQGRSIAFSSEAEFGTVAGHFDLAVTGQSPQWKLFDLELTQGTETFLGEGVTQQDGKLVLDLTSHGRQVHYTGILASVKPQP